MSVPSASADTSLDAVLTRATRHRRWWRLWSHSRHIVLPLVVVVLFTLAWEASVHVFAIPQFLLPAPSAIYAETVATGPTMLKHTRSTLYTVLMGFGISIVISLPLAVMITSSALIANAVYPLLVLTQSIPKVALAPLLVVVLGAGAMPRVIVTLLVAFFPLVISIATGLLSVSTELSQLARSLNMTRLDELWRIRLPYAIPFVFSGLKMAIIFAVVGAVVGEFVAAEEGLGYLITSATAFFRTPLAFGALVILSLMGIALFQIVVIIERVFFPWSAREEASAR
jgi:NitT/TauT family transport system permease protein